MTSLTSTTENRSNGAMDSGTYTYDDRGALTYSNERHYVWFEGFEYTFHEDGTYTTEWIEEWQMTPWLETDYTFDDAGYLQKMVQEVEENAYVTSGHYYNGMEQPGCLGEQ